MDEGTACVGLDVHKRTIAVAVRFPDGGLDERTIPHEAQAANRLVRKWKREAPGEIRCADEAGPCGYGLQRDLKEQGVDCRVIAPSLVPRKPGERIKTDRRDARKLAQLLEGGLLAEVHPPTAGNEAVRELSRWAYCALHGRPEAAVPDVSAPEQPSGATSTSIDPAWA